MLIHLPRDLTEEELQVLKKQRCAISRKHSFDVTLDHFIPVNWGHGGTIQGNVYPLDKELNRTKSSLNPFRWIKRKQVREKVNMQLWEELIRTLAGQNGLTVREFTRYVYWCEQHQRDLEEVRSDPRRSVDLWRERERSLRERETRKAESSSIGLHKTVETCVGASFFTSPFLFDWKFLASLIETVGSGRNVPKYCKMRHNTHPYIGLVLR